LNRFLLSQSGTLTALHEHTVGRRLTMIAVEDVGSNDSALNIRAAIV